MSRPEKPSSAVTVTRGNGVEAWHEASLCVVGKGVGITHTYGDPELVCLARSSIKPFQALALVVSGAADRFGFDARQLALACASHNGTDQHAAVARSMLTQAEVPESALGCGSHLPIFRRLADEPAQHGEEAEPLRHNCSGKHAGFLALCKHLGEPLERYLDPASQTQTLVRDLLALACDVDPSALLSGTDGCSAPNYALPLSALALGMLRLAHPDSAPPQLQSALTRLRDAMLAHPELVSGEGRFDLDLARAFAGNVLCKVGAEGVQLGAFLEPPLAFALKVHDGAERAKPPLCVSLLQQLGLFHEVPATLLRHQRPLVYNHKKLVTGEIIAHLQLQTRSNEGES
ncbi:MAG: asparaginase [Polyangiaceae bacterium]